MKFKKFIKDNIKRISSVILCIVLIFSLSITTYAFDGEAGGLDKAILEEYISDANVFYNPEELPVYSPFNHTTLYYILKWPLVNSGWEVSTKEYLSVTTTSSDGLYYTYYLIPERNIESMDSFHFSVLFDDFTFPDFYELLYGDYSTVSNNRLTVNQAFKTTINQNGILSILPDSPSYADFINGYVYCTVRSSQSNTLMSVSEIYYGSYANCFNNMPTSNIVQIYYHSEESLTRDLPDFFTNNIVSTKNLNYLVSVSTYSVTAYDYFDNNAAANGFMSESVSFTNQGLGRNGGGTPTYYVPECIRGPNYPEGVSSLSSVSTDDNYYLKDGYLTSERSYLFIPTWLGSSSASYMNCIVFPEEVETPILYFKFCKGYSGKYTYLQLLSKVDYDFYYGGILIGSFDAETTTFSCVATAQFSPSQSGYSLYHTLTTDYNNNSNAIVPTSDYIVYPYLMYAHNSYLGSTFSLRHIYGNDMVFSIFPDNSDTLGFYTYVSPSIMEEVLDKGNSGEVGGNIFDNIGGGGFPSDTDWEKMWDFTIDYDSFESDAFKGYERAPYPDMPFATLEDINLFTLPDDVITYMVQCIQWFGDELTRFTEYVGGPVAKVTTIMKMMFENAPDFLGTLFLLFFFFFAIMKIMQFDTSYYLASMSTDIHDHEVQKAFISSIEQERKQKETQAAQAARRHNNSMIVDVEQSNRKRVNFLDGYNDRKVAIAETKRRSTWEGMKSSNPSLKERFESRFGSKDGGS